MTRADLEQLRGGLIVSVQAAPGSALDDAGVMGAMAEAAQAGGAAGVRIASVKHIQSVRKRVRVPIVGILKRRYAGFEPYVTPSLDDLREIVAAGAEIVAFDCTGRPRPDGSDTRAMVEAAHREGALAMADCARAADGDAAVVAGADIVATTLCGYTKETRGCDLPALDLVAGFARLDAFTVCEGGIHSPEAARAALAAGAAAVVVGTAITNVEWLVASFVAGLQRSWQT